MSSKKLTGKQQELLQLIAAQWRAKGRSPTLAELGQLCEVSKAAMQQRVAYLRRVGMLMPSEKYAHRDIVLTESGQDALLAIGYEVLLA
jgi:SOS-response transcriptional repressor LexA